MIQTSIADGVAVLSIDMPGRSMNVLTPELAAALRNAFEAAIADAAVRAIVISSGKSSFIAGADLAQMAPLASAAVSYKDARAAIADYSQLFRRIETAGKPVVGVATGTALGGGLELLLATHYRIASDDPAARYGVPEVTLGLLPGAGGTQRLPRLVGLEASLPLLLEGRPVTAAQALSLGFVDQVAHVAELLNAAHAVIAAGVVSRHARWDVAGFQPPGPVADSLEARTALDVMRTKVLARTHGNQPAPLAILDAVTQALALPMDEALQVELDAFMPLLRGPVSQNMIRTGFFARQSADKLLRRPAQPPRGKVARLGLIGAGAMALELSQVAMLADIAVTLVAEPDQTALAQSKLAQAAQVEVQKGRLTAAQLEQSLSRIHIATSVQALADCELVVDTVSADSAQAVSAATSLFAAVGADTVLAFALPGVAIGEVAAATSHGARVVGLHLLEPLARSTLIEVSAAPATSDAAIARAMDFAKQLRKTPIRIGDGAYVARGQRAYSEEALRLQAEGVDAAAIERAASALGMPNGSLVLGAQALGVTDAESTTHVATNETHIKQRLLYAQLLEAARCWFEGVVSEADDLDLAAHLGWGFPIHLGGPAAAIDQLGIQAFVATLDQLQAQCGARFAAPPNLREAARRDFKFRA